MLLLQVMSAAHHPLFYYCVDTAWQFGLQVNQPQKSLLPTTMLKPVPSQATPATSTAAIMSVAGPSVEPQGFVHADVECG